MYYKFYYETDYLLTLTQVGKIYSQSNKGYTRELNHCYFNVTIFNNDFVMALPIFRLRLNELCIKDLLVIYVTEDGKAPNNVFAPHSTDYKGIDIRFMSLRYLIEHLCTEERFETPFGDMYKRDYH